MKKDYGDGDAQALWGRIDEFRNDANANLSSDDIRELAEWWTELHTSLFRLDDQLAAAREETKEQSHLFGLARARVGEVIEERLAEKQTREQAERKVVWAGDLGKDRIKKAEILAERDEARTQLSAWHKAFGTTQLTHALAERDALAKALGNLMGCDAVCELTQSAQHNEGDDEADDFIRKMDAANDLLLDYDDAKEARLQDRDSS